MSGSMSTTVMIQRQTPSMRWRPQSWESSRPIWSSPRPVTASTCGLRVRNRKGPARIRKPASRCMTPSGTLRSRKSRSRAARIPWPKPYQIRSAGCMTTSSKRSRKRRRKPERNPVRSLPMRRSSRRPPMPGTVKPSRSSWPESGKASTRRSRKRTWPFA